MNVYDQGDVVRLRGSFANSAQVPVDPTSVTFQYIIFPDLTVNTIVYGVGSIIRVNTGEFYHDFPVNTSGELRYRWEGTGDNAAGGEGKIGMSVRFRN